MNLRYVKQGKELGIGSGFIPPFPVHPELPYTAGSPVLLITQTQFDYISG